MRVARPLLIALVTAALAAHVAYWYLPRERTAAVDASSPAGELFTGGAQAVRAWFAYPHQNLGAASGALEDPEAAIAAAARLSGFGEVTLPEFGPFTLPPADALAIAVEPGGEGLAVTLDVFPAIAVIARIAGLVADNPILRGGTTVVSGRPVRVAWRGRSWTLVSEDAPGPRSPTSAPAGEGLAFLALAAPQGAAHPGTYRLRHEGDDLVLASTGGPPRSYASELAERQAREHDLAFLAVRAGAPDAMGLLMMPRIRERGLRLPDSAVAWTAPGQRWRLPGERILRVLGIDPLEGRSGPWSVSAMEQHSLEIATGIAPVLGEAMASEDASFLLWVRPLDYLPLVSTIAGVLSALPIAPRDEVEHWRDLEAVLEAFGAVDRVVVTVAPNASEARLGWGRE